MADDFEKRVRKAFRKVGKEAPKGSRNTRLVDQLAERRRRKAERGSLIGRPPKPPRKTLVGNKIKIRHLGRDHVTGIELSPGMDIDEVLALTEVALDDFYDDLDRANEEDVSPLDKSLEEINQEWIKFESPRQTEKTTNARTKWAKDLKADFPCKLLKEVLRPSGIEYINKMLESVAKDDQNRREIVENACGRKLHMQLNAIGHYYDSLHTPPEQRRGYDIPDRIRRVSDYSLPFDIFERLLKAAQGWRWVASKGKWVRDYDEDLVVVERYIFIYFYSGTRDETILPLKWGIDHNTGSIDTRTGIIYRKPYNQTRTNKRAEPSFMFKPLAEMVREWEKEDFENGWDDVLHDKDGNPIEDMTDRFNRVMDKAGIKCRAHDLKHTGVTYFLHAGIDINVLAIHFSTTAATLQTQYAHLQFLWLKPRTTLKEPDLSLNALKKVVPQSSESWRRRAAAYAAKKEAKRAKRSAKEKAERPRPCGRTAQ
jgi:hypothetical protein